MTTHRMTIPVQAWRVESDGSLPEEARAVMGSDEYPTWSEGTRCRWQVVMDADPPKAERVPCEVAEWQWYDHGTSTMWTAPPGYWVVAHEYGCEAMSDEAFRACCTEVGDA
jgi:hypothetical protein